MKQQILINGRRSTDSLAAEFGAAYRSRTTRSEIGMGDFYGGRPLIMKYMPWWGGILEAGCGLGRYVFYLRRFGFDASGVDVAGEALDECRSYAIRTGERSDLFSGSDVRELNLPDNSIAGYLSLGVIEHFHEGPEAAIAEAHRVLAPGGVAVICTPNRWSIEHMADTVRYALRRLARNSLAAAGLASPHVPRPFDQYWFSSGQLSRFARRAGFTVTHRRTLDLKYAVHEALRNLGMVLARHSRETLFPWMNGLERTPLRVLGGLAFIVAIKEGGVSSRHRRRCFFCGEQRITPGSLSHTVPICPECLSTLPPGVTDEYRPRRPAGFADRERPGEKGQPLASPRERRCSICGGSFASDPDFGLFGLTRPVCPLCLKSRQVRADLLLHGLCEQWRPRP